MGDSLRSAERVRVFYGVKAFVHIKENGKMAKEESSGTGVVLEASRREKLRKIIEMGIDPWGSRFDGQLSIGSVRAREGEIVVGEPIAPPPPPEGQPPSS